MQLPATVTLDEVAALAAALPADLSKGTGMLSVDASALRAFDSSTLALLLQVRRLAQTAGRPFEVSGMPEPLLALASLYGINGLLSSSASASQVPERG